MRKIKLGLSFVFCLLLFPQFGWSQAGGSLLNAQGSAVQSVGASAAYSAAYAAICSPKAIPACIEAIKGILQAIQGGKGAADNARAGSAVTSGDFAQFEFEPNEAGFCLDSSKGCKADTIDNQLKPFGDALKAGKGFDDALSILNKNNEKKLSAFERKGFKIDRANGTVTDPSGNVTKLSSTKTKIPASLKAALEKRANARKKIASGSGRSVASTGGGISYKDEYYGGSSNRKKRKSKSDLDREKRKKSLLAGLSDKDAQKAVIGVHGDNIFGMVNRRYEKKTKSSEFMKK